MDEDIEWGAPKIFRHPKAGALKKLGGRGLQKFVYFKANRSGWTPKKLSRYRGGGY